MKIDDKLQSLGILYRHQSYRHAANYSTLAVIPRNEGRITEGRVVERNGRHTYERGENISRKGVDIYKYYILLGRWFGRACGIGRP